MKRAKIFLAIFSTTLLFLWLLPDGMLAQDINKAALVIRHDDQSVQTACVEFSEPEINGLELLQNSGFDMQLDVQGLGAAVCSIGQTGCPADDCWCQCKGGGECIYWSYWLRLSGQWQYSQGGASTFTVRDGDVQGWSWGPGAVNAALPPPVVSFDEVCTSAVVETDTATPAPTSEPVVFVPEDTPTSEVIQSQPTSTATATPLPTSTIPPTATVAALATAMPTSTLMPTTAATAVPIATEQVISAPLEPQPTAAAVTTDTAPVAAVDQNLDPTATLQPLPSPATAGEEASQPAPEAVAAVAMVGAPAATRPGEQGTKKLIEMPAERQRKLSVVGAAVQAPELRAIPLTSENQVSEIEDGTSSLFSYAVFGLIVLVLLGAVLYSSARRQRRLITPGE